MTSAGKSTYYRVRKVIDYEVAVVAEVAEDDLFGYGTLRETRNPKVCFGGVDSFWLAAGSRKDASSAKKHLPIGKLETIPLLNANRLEVGYSPDRGNYDETVELLRAGRLSVQIGGRVDAINIRKNLWMTEGFKLQPDGHLGLVPGLSVKTARVAEHEGRPETLRLGSDLVLFQVKPVWRQPKTMDLRPHGELIAAAEGWLSRVAATDTDAAVSARSELLQRIEAYISATVVDDENDDLVSAMKLLSDRRQLIDIVPRILLREPEWAKQIDHIRVSEQERIRNEMRDRFAEESEKLEKRLDEVRRQIRGAETELRLAAHREVLLRNESERLDTVLRDRITEAAKQIGVDSSLEARRIRDELHALRDELTRLEQSIPVATPVSVAAEGPEQPLALPVSAPGEAEGGGSRGTVLSVATESRANATLTALASATGLSQSQMMALLLLSLEDVPVLVGAGSARAAAEIAAALGGDEAAIVFCDPTHVSLQDIVNDEAGGFATAVAVARDNPGLVVPVAFCGITSSPCELWLSRIVEMRRLGRLPRNLSVIASAGEDGMRISVPDSLLRYLAPFKVSGGQSSARATVQFDGCIQLPSDVRIRVPDAVEALTANPEADSAFIKRNARMLAGMPSASAVGMSEMADALLAQDAWLKAVMGTRDHDLIKYFKKLEG